MITVKNTTMPIVAGPCIENSFTHKIYCLASDLPQFIEYDPSTDAFGLRDSNYPGRVVWPGCSENSLSNKIYCIGGWETVIQQNTNKIVEYSSS